MGANNRSNFKRYSLLLVVTMIALEVSYRAPLEVMSCLWAFKRISSKISGMFYRGQTFIQFYRFTAAFYLFLDEKHTVFLFFCLI